MDIEQSGEKCLRIFTHILSIIISLTGLGTIVGAIYLWVKTSFNKVVIFLLVLGLFIMVVTILLMIAIKRRPCVILVYIIYIGIVTAFFVSVGMVCRFYKGLIDDLAEKLEDSDAAIAKVKDALENLKDPISIGFIVITFIGILEIVCLIIYRHKVEDIEFEEKLDMEQSESILKDMSGKKGKKGEDDSSLHLY